MHPSDTRREFLLNETALRKLDVPAAADAIGRPVRINGRQGTAGLLLIAFVLAAPLAWWAMNNWLEGFAYRVEIGAGVFALSVLITLLVALVSVGYKSVKAALMDPVRSLRAE